ncbi:TauD/TfdA-like domain [Dillenia turbinata]|uniref:TauD/TfdA-like domain n=1 Tax=Dillenia turbinata TaxID=194707 RepID=A0AAN8VA66_9MAGN
MVSQIFSETQISHQKSYKKTQFPAVLSPQHPSSLKLSDFTQAIKTEKPFLDSVLHSAGVILFRGFPVKTASDFNEVIESFGFEEFFYIGGASPRTNIVGRVFTANESPLDQSIDFHHELAHVPVFPSKLFFCCDVEPKSGGETPVVLSHVIYEKMKDKYPDFVEHLEKHGLIYTRVLGAHDDPSSPIGRGWKATFLTDDKKIAEERAAERGMRLEWTEDGGVKVIVGPTPAIRFDETRQRKIWFNSILGWQYPNSVMFGDGKRLPAEILDDYRKILEEEAVAIPWQKGDVMLVDNWAALHGRRPTNSPRRVLASLCK